MDKTSFQKIKFGPYEVLEEIGSGAMGKVYKAYHPNLDRIIAIKTILNQEQDFRQRFLIEARLMAKLKHPNIVNINDFGTLENIDYIAMDFIEGNSLVDHMEKLHHFPRKSLEIIEKIARAMHYVHKQGVIHRDLKPSNIMIEHDTKLPIVTDFGIAKDLSAETKTGEIAGTPQYMSPEQVKGGKITPVTDVYALGAILYEMISGTYVVSGETIDSIMFNIAHKDFVPLKTLCPYLSPDIEAICNKALEKAPQKRYQTALKFAQDIHCFFRGEIISVRPANFYQRSIKKIKAYKWPLLVFMCFCLLLSIALIVSHLHQKQKQQQKINKLIEKATKIISSISKQSLNVAFEKYMQAISILEVSSQDKKISQKLYQISKNMGKLALKKKKYLLAHIAFARCHKINPGKETLDLLASPKKKQQALKKQQLNYLHKIMKKHRLDANFRDLYVSAAMIARMKKSSYIVVALLPYLKSIYSSQCRIAARALGKIGDRYTKVNGKDSVEWLIEYLKKLTKQKKISQEIVEAILAVSYFGDARAHKVVFYTLANTDNYIFHKYVKTSYRRIPLPQEWRISFQQDLQNIKNKVNFVTKRLKIALAQQWRGNTTEAIKEYGNIIKLYPNFDAYTGRANCLKAMGETLKAIVDYSNAIALNPKNFAAYNNRANAYQDNKNYQKALVDMTYALKLRPRAASVYGNRGVVYQYLQQNHKAISDFSKAIVLDPYAATSYMNRGNIYQKNGMFKKAIADYNKALRISPNLEMAYNNRAYAKKLMGNINGAIDDSSYAIKLKPRFAMAYYTRSLCYLEKKEWSKALADTENAIKLKFDIYAMYIHKGLVYWRLGDLHQAIYWTKKATQKAKYSAAAYYNIACYYGHLRNQEKALEFLEIALKKGFKNLQEMRKKIQRDLKKGKALFFIRKDPGLKRLIAKYYK